MFDSKMIARLRRTSRPNCRDRFLAVATYSRAIRTRDVAASRLEAWHCRGGVARVPRLPLPGTEVDPDARQLAGTMNERLERLINREIY